MSDKPLYPVNVPTVISGLELTINKTPAQLIDLIDARVAVTRSTIENIVEMETGVALHLPVRKPREGSRCKTCGRKRE